VTPVYQTIIDSERGDCQRACVATIMDRPIEEVPNFVEAKLWKDLMSVWVQAQGWGIIETKQPCGPNNLNWSAIRGLVAIATVPSQVFPGGKHAIVVGWREHPDHEEANECYVVHDPNPNNAPYENVAGIVERLEWLVRVNI